MGEFPFLRLYEDGCIAGVAPAFSADDTNVN